MAKGFRIRLAPKNEHLEYQDGSGSYQFEIRLNNGKTWLVYLPCAKAGVSRHYRFTEEERSRILPRVEADLRRIWWFGVWPISYDVRIVDDEEAPNHWFEGDAVSSASLPASGRAPQPER